MNLKEAESNARCCCIVDEQDGHNAMVLRDSLELVYAELLRLREIQAEYGRFINNIADLVRQAKVGHDYEEDLEPSS